MAAAVPRAARLANSRRESGVSGRFTLVHRCGTGEMIAQICRGRLRPRQGRGRPSRSTRDELKVKGNRVGVQSIQADSRRTSWQGETAE